MNDLKNAKTLGGIGSILMLIGIIIPTFGLILSLVGFILVIIAVNNISNAVNESSIFSNYLFSFFLQIASVVALFAILFVTIGANITLSFSELTTLAQSEQGITDPSQIFSDIGAVLGGICLSVVVFWIIMLISSLFLKKSFDGIKQKTKVDLFGTAGLLFLIGAGLLIIVVGAIIIFIALIIQIVAFFQLPDQVPAAETSI